ncbi:MAG: hypothetical protein ABSF29_08815 [Tepidisphaeraceae bacterium]|jgi:hypothetical protein
MGQLKKLIDVVAALGSLDPNATIYAAKPWSQGSLAVVEFEPPSHELPREAAQAGAEYFLEVFVARDFLSDWEATLDKMPSLEERCDRLIRYAVDDA